MQIQYIAEDAVMMRLGDIIDIGVHRQLITLQKQINNGNYLGITEAVIGFTTLVVYFDPMHTSHITVEKLLRDLSKSDLEISSSPTVHHIPVCYDYGLDIHYVANYHQITVEEVIELHISAVYTVYFIGFSPGFPFLGGMNDKIATPRKAAPRQSVEAGSIGIAGKQTGIYPGQSPGGWQIIGRTPVNLVKINNEQPTLLQSGDQIHFYPINKKEFLETANNEGLEQ
ncbi:5-oxoprolinase subunit PxpB [Gracilibacillus oryzae]|uniref:5-oxoprolinase subunit PxpB n=1 Tax=Gracilibacillus oryzae TaxID=1672701 RepID=A0A7C8GQE1_9BACI|nr:5-oxoprolinase subunit PxpB [Gracilibacillus oryzae]KAB8125855.1 5-oxoprolinase subunit PxpB [Gracilibacillus oryzae]